MWFIVWLVFAFASTGVFVVQVRYVWPRVFAAYRSRKRYKAWRAAFKARQRRAIEIARSDGTAKPRVYYDSREDVFVHARPDGTRQRISP